jgi:hypothetical protein
MDNLIEWSEILQGDDSFMWREQATYEQRMAAIVNFNLLNSKD